MAGIYFNFNYFILIRIFGSISVKTRNAYNSGSGRNPDPQIKLKIMRMSPDSDFRIRTQEFYARMKREPGSGPVKKFIKTRNAYNSRSGRDPDPRIDKKIMRMGPNSVYRIRTQKFYA
jgi:hypothetical protein